MPEFTLDEQQRIAEIVKLYLATNDLNSHQKLLINTYIENLEKDREERANKRTTRYAFLVTLIGTAILSAIAASGAYIIDDVRRSAVSNFDDQVKSIRLEASESVKREVNIAVDKVIQDTFKPIRMAQIVEDVVNNLIKINVEAQIVQNQISERIEASRLTIEEVQRLRSQVVTLHEGLRNFESFIQFAGDVQSLKAELGSNLQKPEFAATVAARGAFPASAVVAFDSAGGCPAGWKPLPDAQGRFIIGAGSSANTDRKGTRLSEWRFRSVGGEETHTLTLDEIPSHSHSVYPHAGLIIGVSGRFPGAGSGDPNPTSRTDGLTSEQGGSKPHNIMPPFLALFYCVKT